MNRIWETLVRWRTWFVNVSASLLILLPELLNAPEVIAVILPLQYQKYVFVAALLLNVVMRPRAAAIAGDPEVLVRDAIKATDGPTRVVVKQTGGDTTATIHA